MGIAATEPVLLARQNLSSDIFLSALFTRPGPQMHPFIDSRPVETRRTRGWKSSLITPEGFVPRAFPHAVARLSRTATHIRFGVPMHLAPPAQEQGLVPLPLGPLGLTLKLLQFLGLARYAHADRVSASC
jgi:hypothetical protein